MPENRIFAEDIVAGYYYTGYKAALPAEKIKYENLTHINHSFAWPNPDGSISANSDFYYTQLIDSAHANGKKILAALGGWGQSQGFSPMAADSITRATFIENLINFCYDYRYDGVDIDWEYPATTSDKDNLNFLIREIREAFNETGEDWLITMAVPAGAWAGQWFDFNTLKKYIDWFGAMTYDFMGSWVSIAYHNSPLFPPSNPDMGSVKSGIQYLNINRQIPKGQLLIGIPFYGRGCNATRLFAANTGDNVEYRYSEIVPLLASGWTYFWDDISKVPYLMNISETKFISYDNPTSVRFKCEYAQQQNLAGVMLWALGQDVIGNDQALLEAVGRSMGLVSDIDESPHKEPTTFLLLNNYPNPFNAGTVIPFYLPEETMISLEVYNLLGQRIAIILNEKKPCGWHEVYFKAAELPSGVYFYRVQGSSFSKMLKMVILK